MFSPTKIIKSQIKDNALVCTCQTGTLCLTPYSDDIIHVSYYPSTPKAITMWGIEAKPDSAVNVNLEENEDSITFALPKVFAKISKSNGAVSFYKADGTPLTSLTDYFLEPATVLGENTYHLNTTFSANEDECFYGLGQHQDGKLNLAGRELVMWHDYSHAGGEVIAVPFLISSKKYAIILDNPSRSKITAGLNGETRWNAEVGDSISLFFIAAQNTDDLYLAYRKLSGATPLPPRSGLGFIQCKQRYASQEEILKVAKTYYEKKYPCDILVVDWFHWKTLGDMSLDAEYWPDSLELNRQLNEMGYEAMISCWPRFMKESTNYDLLEEKGWFMKDEKGQTVYGTPQDQRGALIDTTNEECGKWYFDTIKKNYADLGYKYWWTDENEPDISPHEAYLHAGTGARVHNIYPLTHTKCIYEGHRKNLPHRCLTLSRSAWTGAQKYGTTFWSSDIFPEWDVLKRQIPTALNFCASGMPYWSSDIGGWQELPDEKSDEDYSCLLLATQNSGERKVTKKNFTELYIRWFQFGIFCPTFRTHGTRKHNEVWSYGEDAEKILVKYLKLRYKLMPYIYSLAYNATKTGSPFMRALWMDFDDKACAEINDQFMFGDAMLIAPIVEQGAVSRKVYLPKGHSWYDFYTNKLYEGGQTIIADAPIDKIPIFVKSGSIIPLGEDVLNMKTAQREIVAQVYSGEDASFTLYSDDGRTYDYEKGAFDLTELKWNNQTEEATAQTLNSFKELEKANITFKIIKES